MIKPLKIKITSEQNVFFVSDTHFGHNKDFIYAKRGFTNVQEHDETLIRIINETVRENDYLVHCGDFSLNTTEERFEEILSQINCRRILYLWGNHNSPLQGLYFRDIAAEGVLEAYPAYHKNLCFVGSYLELDISYQKSPGHVGGKHIVCCHYPIQEFNDAKRGNWMLCGHSHYGNPMTRADNPNGKYLDLGWEGHGKPLSFAEVKDIMSKKEILSVSHH